MWSNWINKNHLPNEFYVVSINNLDHTIVVNLIYLSMLYEKINTNQLYFNDWKKSNSTALLPSDVKPVYIRLVFPISTWFYAE